MSEELKQMLLERYESELRDVLTYDSIYNAMLDEGLIDDASVIEHIANQEHNHASYIKEMLREVGVKTNKNEMEHKVEKVFMD